MNIYILILGVIGALCLTPNINSYYRQHSRKGKIITGIGVIASIYDLGYYIIYPLFNNAMSNIIIATDEMSKQDIFNTSIILLILLGAITTTMYYMFIRNEKKS